MARLRRILTATLVGIVALELVLQVGSLVIHWTSAGPEAADGSGPAILCIGDSYTYGLGASAQARSYPGVMEKLLRERVDRQIRVVNAGWPGQNSRTALTNLTAQLATHTPRLVFVLVGLNDSWSDPERLDLDEARQLGDSGGWRLRWRTGVLLDLLFGGGEATPGEEALPPADGASPTEAGPGGKRTPSSPFEEGLAAMQQGRPQDAIPLFEKAAAVESEHSAEAHQGLVQAYLALGQRDRAMAAIGWLEERWRQQPDRRVAEALAMSRLAAGDRESAAAGARAALDRFPGSSTLWWVSGRDRYEAGDFEAASRDYDRALSGEAAGDPAWRAALLRDLARACGAHAPRRAVKALLEAQQIDGDVARGRTIVEALGEKLSGETVGAVIREMALGGRDLERARRLFADSWDGDGDAFDVLGHHLQQMVLACRDGGAVPVLLTYPFLAPKIESIQLGVASSMDVELVRIRDAFAPIVQEHGRDALFIADGHCNDAGYELMGRLAADAAVRLLRR